MVPGLMRTPSTSTSVWLLSAPRMNTAVVWPGPPLRPRSSPAWKRSSSVTSPAALRSMASRSMTITGASTSSSGVGDAGGGDHHVVGGCGRRRKRPSRRDCRRASGAGRQEQEQTTHRCRHPVRAPRAVFNSESRREGAAGRRASARNPAARPPRGWSRPTGRSPGSRVDLLRSRPHPLPANVSQWAPETFPADAGSTRLPLRGQRRNSTGFPFSRASRAGSPDGARKVGKAAGCVKRAAG